MGEAVPKPTRVHDDAFLAFIRTQRCLVRESHVGIELQWLRVEAAHVVSIGAGGGDDLVVPLCAWHHRIGPGAVHWIGRETFEGQHGMDLGLEAAKLRGYFLDAPFAP